MLLEVTSSDFGLGDLDTSWALLELVEQDDIRELELLLSVLG